MMKSELLKVTPADNGINPAGGHHIARSFDRFKLRSLRGDICSFAAMLGGDAFTEVYFRTESGNIYKFFRDKDEHGHPNNWVLINKNNPNTKYYPIDAEMYYGSLELGESFFYGTGGLSSKVTEIVCVNTSRIYMNGSGPESESTLVQLFNTALKGRLAVDAITKKM